MGKSLTETAKAILQEGSVGGYPSVSPMGAGSPERDVMSTTPAKSSLRPGSGYIESKPFANPNSNSPALGSFEDLGPALTQQGDVPPSAKAAGKVGKDKTRSSVPATGSEPYGSVKKSPSAVQPMAEEIELSEELEAFIEEMMAEGYSDEEIAEAIEENFELVSEEKHEEEEDEDEEDEEDEDEKNHMKEGKMPKPPGPGESWDNHSYVKALASGKIKPNRRKTRTSDEPPGPKDSMDDWSDYGKKMMKEHVDALLAGENLSEDFRSKAETIFESAVNVRVNEEVETLEEAYAAALEEEVANIRAELSEQVDDYLNYVVEQWVQENEVAIESGVRSELTEDFISGLRNLFAEHYIDIPDDKVNVIEGLGSKVEELEAKLNEEIERNVTLNRVLSESKRFEVLVDACDGLTTTQAEKLKTLAENIEFTTTDEFANKVMTLRESYFSGTNINNDYVLDTIVESDNGKGMITENLQGPMAQYVKALGKTIPR